MDAVGNVSDGNRVFEFAGEESGPHSAGDFTVQRGNGIGVPRELQAEHGHAETFVAFGMLAPQGHEVFFGKTERLRRGPRWLFDQIGIEAVVAGGHGSVVVKTTSRATRGTAFSKPMPSFFHALAIASRPQIRYALR